MLLLNAVSGGASSIAFGGTAAIGNTTSSTTFTASYTVQSTSNFLVIGAVGDTASNLVTGITYNLVAMTQLIALNPGSTGQRWMYFYYLVNPATGANNAIMSASSSITMRMVGCDYSGVNSVTPIDNSTSTTTASASSMSYPLTTSQSNAWIVALSETTQSPTGTGGGYTMLRSANPANNNPTIWDSNGPIATPGSVTNSLTLSTANTMTGIAVSIRHG